jgi:hypothetical protein
MAIHGKASPKISGVKNSPYEGSAKRRYNERPENLPS